MAEERPLISIVTASYNMGHYVCQAVDSVLAQDYPRLEVIVVDDGSEDDTQSRLDRYRDDPRVKLIHQENKGQTAAKNRGLADATGDFVGFCDADNTWREGKLATQLAVFAETPELGVVYGDIQLMDGEGQFVSGPKVNRLSGTITAPLLVDNFVTFNTTLIPKRILDEMNGFDERLRMAIDYDLWLRISLKYKFHYIDEYLVNYRIWAGQMSHRTGDRMDNFFKLLENFLAENPGAVTPAEARHAWAHSHTTKGIWLSRSGHQGEAWREFSKAFGRRPHDKRLWKSAIKSLLGR